MLKNDHLNCACVLSEIFQPDMPVMKKKTLFKYSIYHGISSSKCHLFFRDFHVFFRDFHHFFVKNVRNIYQNKFVNFLKFMM